METLKVVLVLLLSIILHLSLINFSKQIKACRLYVPTRKIESHMIIPLKIGRVGLVVYNH